MIKSFIWPALLALLCLVSCREDYFVNEKFIRPEWLAGKVYTQIEQRGDTLSTFARAIKLSGYDTIINVSGSYTVFAPSNDAFERYFSENPNYNSIDDMPVAELSRLVKYHIVQYPWSKLQLRSLDIGGWIDTLSTTNNKPRGYKHETLLREDNVKYGVELMRTNFLNYNTIIVDTLASDWHRTVITDSRKYVPVFFQEYFDIYELQSDDYEFYFNRPFEGSNEIYYANAKIISEEIFAENGFVYVVDEVVEPLMNAYQFLNQGENNKYGDFLDIANLFSDFQYNENRTNEQSGAEEGLTVDSLFDVTYPDLTFNLSKENTGASGPFSSSSFYSIRFHHGLMAPTNEALAQFEQKYFAISNGWGSIKDAPLSIKEIVANTYMSPMPIYRTQLMDGFYNGESDKITLDESKIIQKNYGSNCTFVGLNEALVPRAFSSVTGPVYLKRGYSKVRVAIEKSDLLPALKRENRNYMFFVESDVNTSIDSSLIYEEFEDRFFVFSNSDDGDYVQHGFNSDNIRTLLLNHIASAQPKGVASKEFIPNLAGNYIIVNNKTGEFSGTAPTSFGYNGSELIPEFPTLISTDSDNGKTYDIDNWFSFVGSSLFTTISTSYLRFHNLLRRAGLSNDNQFRYNFISDSEFYTVFIPSDEALETAQVDTLSNEELKDLLLLHFVQGDLIFTDGNKSGGYYETSREDEASTQFSIINTKIYIEPGIDVIKIRDKDGGIFTEILESENTNQLTAISLGEGNEVIPQLVNNAVIHQMDEVLKIGQIDSN